uniref:Chloride channel CLIC-like protein 1 n=1 Tax=Panagrolaimus superbus TaxID=310955 RepID=A0A914YWV5_9BILA
MLILIFLGLFLVGIHGINEIPQHSNAEELDVPGDPFSDENLPKLNFDDKKCNLEEYTKEYQKVIKEWEERYKKLVKLNHADVDVFFKQFIEEFAYRLNFKLDDTLNGINRTAIVAFLPKDIALLKDYISKTDPTKSLRTQAKDKLIKSVYESFDASPLAKSAILPNGILIGGFLIIVAFAVFFHRFLAIAPNEYIISTIIIIFLTIFMISCWSHYNMRLEEAVARYKEKQSKFTGKECEPLTSWQWFSGTILGYVTIKRDTPCYEYHLNMQQNVKHQIKLTKIIGEVFTEWISSGLFVIGEPIRAFCDSLYKDAPLQMIPLLTAIFILVFGFIFIFLFLGTLRLFNVKIHSPFIGISFGSKDGNTVVADQQKSALQMKEMIAAITAMNQRLEDSLRQNNAIKNQGMMPREIEGVRRRGSRDPQVAKEN